MNTPEIEYEKRVSEENRRAVVEYISGFPEGGPPAILSLEHLSLLIGIRAETIFGITNSPSSFYRTFKLKKACGGFRRIDAPLPSVLMIQQWILSNILEKIECHPAAKAYIRGQSIKTNAKFHRAQKYILKVDVENFFGSIKEYHVANVFIDIGYTTAVSVGLAKLCCLNGCLPQGAATSGYLSNIILKKFDKEVFDFSRDLKLRYSRYADDITFSGESIDKPDVIKKVGDLFKPLSLKINRQKTKLVAKNNKQKVTGVVVNKKLSVEKTYLRDLRKSHYFVMKHGIFGHARYNKPTSPKVLLDQLIGKVSFAIFIRHEDKKLLSMKEDLLKERKTAFGY